jgi:acyl carrier protein
VAPVDFTSAVRQMRAAGVGTFLECASGSTLGALAAKSAERVESVTAAQRGNERLAVTQARALLGGNDVAPVPQPVSVPILRPAPQPVPQPAAQPVGSSRADLFTELQGMYAEALEYPAEVFTEDVALEAELGVDSVKQTELFARTVERYELPQPSEAIQLAQFDTMGKVVDLVWSLMSGAGRTESALTARSAA